MNVLNLLNEKPVECLCLLVSISFNVLYCGNLYEQAIIRRIDLPKERIWIENKNSHNNRNNYLDLALTDARASGDYLATATNSSVNIIAVQLNS